MAVRRPCCLYALVLSSALLLPPFVHAYGLLEGFQLARQNDPQYQSASAEREAGAANRQLGQAQLLPTLSASFNRSKVTGSDTAPDFLARCPPRRSST